jgi:hypothetical protein
MNTTLIHTAISAAAIYVPAYVLKATLATTIIVWSVAMVVSSFVVKMIPGGSQGITGTEMIILSLIPIGLIGYKFGVQGVIAYFITSVIAGFVSVALIRGL